MFKKDDLEILKKFDFEVPPVAVGFLNNVPAGLKKLDYPLSFCEMPKKAREGEPFYSDHSNACPAGSYYLGFVDESDKIMEHYQNGEWGIRLGFVPLESTIRRIYSDSPKLNRNQIKYVAFSTLDKLNFNIDILFIVANPVQTNTILRAMSYYDGRAWESKVIHPAGCAWLFIHPYLTGKINYGMCDDYWGREGGLAKGDMMITIPFDQLPILMSNLKDVLEGRPEHMPADMAQRRNNLMKEFGLTHRMAGTPNPPKYPY